MTSVNVMTEGDNRFQILKRDSSFIPRGIKCHTCVKTKSNYDFIACSLCKNFYHTDCAEICKEDFEKMCDINLKVNVKWLCAECNSRFFNLSEIAVITNSLKVFSKKISECTEIIENKKMTFSDVLQNGNTKENSVPKDGTKQTFKIDKTNDINDDTCVVISGKN